MVWNTCPRVYSNALHTRVPPLLLTIRVAPTKRCVLIGGGREVHVRKSSRIVVDGLLTTGAHEEGHQAAGRDLSAHAFPSQWGREGLAAVLR